MRKNIFKVILLIFLQVFTFLQARADSLDDYTTLRDIDEGTFNEYRYYLIEDYLDLKEGFEVNEKIEEDVVENIISHAEKGFNYLPDSLKNENYLRNLKNSLNKGLTSPSSEEYYRDIEKKLEEYILDVNIEKIKGNISVSPDSGNAPLTVTFRAKNVVDPTGTVIPENNYTWWFDVGGVKKIVGRGLDFKYTFTDQGEYTVFLDVESDHKNDKGYTDVIPFSSRGVVEVEEKIASIIIDVEGISLKDTDEIKFTPEEGSYGLVIDATSSTPTSGASFKKTQWDFGNDTEKSYDGDPKIERVVYAKEGDYDVTLKLTTNEGDIVEREFTIIVRDPIATIESNIEDGYIGDKFTFSARSSINKDNLTISWKIVDIDEDKVLTTKNGEVLIYSFEKKGKYNIQLNVEDSAGNEDSDTKIIYINSRAPVVDFDYKISDTSKPNKILFDGTKTVDPDFNDTGKLEYVWTIDGEIVELDPLDSKGLIGYYTFDSIGGHLVSLEATDPEEMSGIKQKKVVIDSTLSVDFYPFPRVTQRGGFVKFVVSSPDAKYYEWDFGDGEKENTNSNKMDYIYEKSGVFTVKLKVKDIDGNENTVSKIVYVGESNAPYSVISIDYGNGEIPAFDSSACSGGAYIVDRTKLVNFKGGESLNLDGKTTGLSYTWKIGNNKYVTNKDTTYKFDELGCYPIKLTVKSDDNGALHSSDTRIKVENLKPTLTTLTVSAEDESTDPVIISVSALGAEDPDGVIQSYLWYYYTDTDLEPQDFRITKGPQTSFVIPKITGNYYFVVVMRDDNDERSSSEDETGNKYFITLNGDNVNTPLIDFKVNKNSVDIGDEVVFTTEVQNVLGQDISKNSEFAWDFDGDGFYDKETNIGDISYVFEESGTFYVKVRVEHKGMTNVRTIEMDVANVLSPDFEYISIGNTYVFFNTSNGKYDSVIWDMGDGNKVNDKDYFVYTYDDSENVHNVNLKIYEGTKTKEETKEVVRNFKNLISSKNADGLYLLSSPEISSGSINIKNSSQKAVLYIFPKDDIGKYAVDFDIETDSDLNGTKDDDIDNKDDESYEEGGLLEIVLNDRKIQTFRVFIFDTNGDIIDSEDIIINKEYIEEEEIDADSIIFNGITDTEKQKIEKLKTYIQGLPQEDRLNGMKYIQKLQESWFYLTEKTKVILEFEAFIDELGVSNGTDIIDLLESLLIEGQEDQSFKNKAYNTVKNLIPEELENYDEIIEKLDSIKSNPEELEDNKVLGKEILESIKDTQIISNEDKMTIRTQLQVFIYGSLENIPEELLNETKNEEKKGNKIVGLFTGVFNIIGIIFGVIFVVILGFFIRFKVSGNNKNQGLQDFIIEKTSGGKSYDILSDLGSGDTKKEEKQKDEVDKNSIIRDISETKQRKINENKDPLSSKEEEKMPDWLSGAIGGKKEKIKETKSENGQIGSKRDILETKKTELQENKKLEKKLSKKVDNKKEQVPDWLVGAMKEEDKKEKDVKRQENKEEIQEKKDQEEEQVPDWLAGSLGETKDVKEKNEGAKDIKNQEDEEKIPDWLAGSIGEAKETEVQEEKEKNKEVKIPKKQGTTEKDQEEEQVPDWLTGVVNEDKIVSQEEVQEKKSTKSERKTKKASSSKKVTKKNEEEELWDDGMEVPKKLKKNASGGKGKKKEDEDDDFWDLDKNSL